MQIGRARRAATLADGRTLARLRLLLVEDDPNDAELVQSCLAEARRGGAEIVHAATLADALRVLRAQPVDVAVVDLDLPDSFGFHTLEALGAATRSPIIVVTGNPHPALAAEALKRRAFEVLPKSRLDARSLMTIVRRASHGRAVERALRLSQMYAALSEANEASANLDDESELYQRICDIAVRFGGMRLASVRLPGPGSHWLQAGGCAGEALDYMLGARISMDPSLPEGRGPGGEAMRENRTVVSNDFAGEPRLAPWHEAARRFGFAAVACVPLRRAGAAIGVLILYAAQAGYFDADLITLVERMAANVGHALERLDAQRRLRESEARFRSLASMHAALSAANEAILRAKGPQELLSRVCEIAVAAGNFVLATAFMPDPATGLLRRVAASGPATAFSLGDTPGPGSMILAAWHAREVTICNDYQNDPRTVRSRRRARAFPHPVASGGVWPLSLDGAPAGVLSLLHAEKGAFSEEMNRLLQRLAENLSFALANFAHEERRLQAEQELRRFRAALNASAESIFLVDADAMQIIDLNDAAAHLLGYQRADIIGASPAALFEGHGEAEVRAEYERMSADAAQPFRAHLRRRDGTLVPVEGSRHLLRSAGRSYVVGIARDITERIKSEERLQQSLQRFEMVARATNDVVWDWNLLTDELWWNENFSAVFGYDPAEVGAYVDAWTRRIHPADAARISDDIQGALERGEHAWTAEYRFRRKDGSYASVFDRGLTLRDAAGRPVRMIGAMIDITERKRAERKMALHAQRQEIIARLGQFALGGADLEQILAEAVRVLRAGGCDVAAIIERVGESGYEFVVRAARGEDAESSVGKAKVLPAQSKWATLVDSGSGAVQHDREYFEARDTDRPWSFWLRRLGSGVYAPIRSETGPFGILMMGSRRDQAFDAEDLSFAEAIAHVLSTAVRRHQTQSRLAYMAEFDSLTGLPNRNLLQDRLNQSLAQARRREWQGAVLFIDLDRFKLINDTLGHHVGDRLITEVGRRLKQCVRGGDTVGRVSGDEFAVVLTDLAQADDAAIVAQKILDALARPFDLGGNEAYVTASIGISVFPADGEDAETLLKNADMAMYRAKELTRNAYCFFTGEMNQRSVAKLQLNTDLRRAIERGEFVLHYQPKVDLRDGRIQGVEALLRWNHPQRGMVAPSEFIPALEDSGLILPVGEWVLSEAARQLGAWRSAGLAAVPVAVNLSAKQFRRRDLDALVDGVLAATGVQAHLIELEITESCLMDEPEEAVRLLERLRAAGLKISVDDFGTGYSSLSYLTRLPLTALKIDRSFVRDAVTSTRAASIVRAIIDMAHNLGFTVIAEGVETEEQVAFLRRHGCDLGQGFHFAHPMDAPALGATLRASP